MYLRHFFLNVKFGNDYYISATIFGVGCVARLDGLGRRQVPDTSW